MNVVFLGTGSAAPSQSRNVTSIALQVDGEVWLFDCGEGTQRQLMHSSLSTGSVTRIFVTHLHGDHVYGLPGLICGLGAAHNDGNPPVEIYGPPGLRNMLHELLKVTTTRYTRMKHAQRVQVHELHPKHAAEDQTRLLGKDLYLQQLQGKTQGWMLIDDPSITVAAVPIKHTVQCIGYTIIERDWTKVCPEKAKALGVSGRLLGVLQEGHSVTLENGTLIEPEAILSTQKRLGRKVVVLGDTCDPSGLLEYGAEPDLLIHEATYATALENMAIARGHSSARMAGDFARALGAETLVVTHFSNRYRFGPSSTEMEVDHQIEEADKASAMAGNSSGKLTATDILTGEAKEAFGSERVVAAHDFMMLSLPRHPFHDTGGAGRTRRRSQVGVAPAAAPRA